MKRSDFLKALAAIPFLGTLVKCEADPTGPEEKVITWDDSRVEGIGEAALPPNDVYVLTARGVIEIDPEIANMLSRDSNSAFKKAMEHQCEVLKRQFREEMYRHFYGKV
jgi:hypothetical protein